jgi:hypothetical protein
MVAMAALVATAVTAATTIRTTTVKPGERVATAETVGQPERVVRSASAAP